MNRQSSGTYCNDAKMEQIKLAMGRSDAEPIELISVAMQTFPADARLTLLRGSIYASQGNYGAAHADLTQAIALDPGLHAARFMLGYLELCHTQTIKAAAVWWPLTEVTDNDAMRNFARGMLSLIEDDFVDAARLFEEGLRHEGASPEISSFIQALLINTRRTMEGSDSGDDITSERGSHLLLSGYTLNL
ncbi:MAG: hypothetical protein ACRES5_34870 [Pseudomonas sp.]|uniref:hypothetical protein n=1 Tax=Stenotrophomonas sp. TaxID=69392 RepID=UPI003D6CD357